MIKLFSNSVPLSFPDTVHTYCPPHPLPPISWSKVYFISFFKESAFGFTNHLYCYFGFGSFISALYFISSFLLYLGVLCSLPSILSLKAWLICFHSFLFSNIFNHISAFQGIAFSLLTTPTRSNVK